MKFAFTSFDKAILAAFLAPITSLATSFLNGGNVDGKDLAAALIASAIAGVVVYFKANKAPAPVAPVVAAAAPVAPVAPAPPASA